MICLKVLYATRCTGAIIAVIRGVCYGVNVIWCVLCEQKRKMKQSLFPFWYFALSPFFFIYFFITSNNCFDLDEGKMTSPVTLSSWTISSGGMWLNVTSIQASWDLAKWEVANILILSCINEYFLGFFLYVWHTYILMQLFGLLHLAIKPNYNCI